MSSQEASSHNPIQYTSTTTYPGFPDYETFMRTVPIHRSRLFWKKQAKTVLDAETLVTILTVLRDPRNEHDDPQFRRWVRKRFTLDNTRSRVLHRNLPVVAEENYYEILCYCHADHGGRDRTHAAFRGMFSWIPKRIVAEFVKLCPTCMRKGGRNPDIVVNRTKPQRSTAKATSTQQQSSAIGTEPLRTDDDLNNLHIAVPSEVPAVSRQPSDEDLLAYSESTPEYVGNINDQPTTIHDRPYLTSQGPQGLLGHFPTYSDIHLYQALPEGVPEEYNDWEARQMVQEYMIGCKTHAATADDQTSRIQSAPFMDEGFLTRRTDSGNEPAILPHFPNTRYEGEIYCGNVETIPTGLDNNRNTLTPFCPDTQYIDPVLLGENPVTAVVEQEVMQEQASNWDYYAVDSHPDSYSQDQFTADTSAYWSTIAAENHMHASQFVDPRFALHAATTSAQFENVLLAPDWNLERLGGIDPSYPVSFSSGPRSSFGGYPVPPPCFCHKCRNNVPF